MNKSAIIIGGSTGIGLNIAKILGGRGIEVTIIGRSQDLAYLEVLGFDKTIYLRPPPKSRTQRCP